MSCCHIEPPVADAIVWSTNVESVGGWVVRDSTTFFIYKRRRQRSLTLSGRRDCLPVLVEPYITTPTRFVLLAADKRRTDPVMSAAPWLYPPATTFELGHLLLARLNSLMPSLMAAVVVPSEAKLSKRPAEYGPPMPWQATRELP